MSPGSWAAGPWTWARRTPASPAGTRPTASRSSWSSPASAAGPAATIPWRRPPSFPPSWRSYRRPRSSTAWAPGRRSRGGVCGGGAGRRIRALGGTVPGDAYEGYRAQREEILRSLGVRRLRFLDEPLAAALGYGLGRRPARTAGGGGTGG